MRRIEQVVEEKTTKEAEEETFLGRPSCRRHLNWRSVWRTTDLDYAGVRLVEPSTADSVKPKLLADFGITEDGARIRFVRRKFHKLKSSRGERTRIKSNKYMT